MVFKNLDHLGVQVRLDDGLPQHVCPKCKRELQTLKIVVNNDNKAVVFDKLLASVKHERQTDKLSGSGR